MNRSAACRQFKNPYTYAIKAEMKRKKLTAPDLAMLMNVSVDWLRRRLYGRTKWSMLDAARVADTLDVGLGELWERGKVMVRAA